jgi:hypothetical protein
LTCPGFSEDPVEFPATAATPEVVPFFAESPAAGAAVTVGNADVLVAAVIGELGETSPFEPVRAVAALACASVGEPAPDAAVGEAAFVGFGVAGGRLTDVPNRGPALLLGPFELALAAMEAHDFVSGALGVAQESPGLEIVVGAESVVADATVWMALAGLASATAGSPGTSGLLPALPLPSLGDEPPMEGFSSGGVAGAGDTDFGAGDCGCATSTASTVD